MAKKRLLTPGVNNPKTAKGLVLNWSTTVLHLAPASLSGIMNVCPHSTAGCRAACLNTAGRGGIFKAGAQTTNIQEARIRRTVSFKEDRLGFIHQLSCEVDRHWDTAAKLGLQPCARLNGTSDIRWESVLGAWWFRERSLVKFYDYTKDLNRMESFLLGRIPANYHLTFSASENTDIRTILSITSMGGNVAVVFDEIPETYLGIPVINGDEHDLRFLDQRGRIVGLKAKGRAKKDTSGFVRRGCA